VKTDDQGNDDFPWRPSFPMDATYPETPDGA